MKKFFKKVHAKQAGFTLIELLVVIAIIGILAAIIVPNVSRYINSGNTAAGQSELKIVQNAVGAAMAEAKVASVAGWSAASNFDATHDLDTGKDRPGGGGDIKVGDYFGASTPLSSLKGVYTVTTVGSVTQVSYTP